MKATAAGPLTAFRNAWRQDIAACAGASQGEVLVRSKTCAFFGKLSLCQALGSWAVIAVLSSFEALMKQRLSTVTCPMTAHVSARKRTPSPLPAELRYGSTDPYAVRLSLGPSTGTPVTWVFARELLAEGLQRSAGPGDVQVIPWQCGTPHSIRIVLNNANGTALVELAAAEVAAFLRQTFTLVPPGTESDHLDLDGAITALTGRSR
ncbi:SsgA family sporulation/cell division regulator [Streptomyces sp. PBH53]|uniref:SsgA family sporulation/cell division regulator n=1 Tax=Streptomyces sp. PBH53 TaxID=1577075 RepID=UPI0021C3D5D2|nr:SsgA family sporulation/cell division regulator [Streptomyces sp. PBH53]